MLLGVDFCSKGFDIVKEDVRNPVFDFSKEARAPVEFVTGKEFPKEVLQVNNISNSRTSSDLFESKEDYMKTQTTKYGGSIGFGQSDSGNKGGAKPKPSEAVKSAVEDNLGFGIGFSASQARTKILDRKESLVCTFIKDEFDAYSIENSIAALDDKRKNELKNAVFKTWISKLPEEFTLPKVSDITNQHPPKVENYGNVKLFMDFIRLYGTHYVEKVLMGGEYWFISSNYDVYLKKTDHKIVKLDADLSWNTFKGGINASYDREVIRMNHEKKTIEEWQQRGGKTAVIGAERWTNITSNAVVVDAKLKPLSSLLHLEPKKAAALKKAVDRYVFVAQQNARLEEFNRLPESFEWEIVCDKTRLDKAPVEIRKGYFVTDAKSKRKGKHVVLEVVDKKHFALYVKKRAKPKDGFAEVVLTLEKEPYFLFVAEMFEGKSLVAAPEIGDANSRGLHEVLQYQPNLGESSKKQGKLKSKKGKEKKTKEKTKGCKKESKKDEFVKDFNADEEEKKLMEDFGKR